MENKENCKGPNGRKKRHMQDVAQELIEVNRRRVAAETEAHFLLVELFSLFSDRCELEYE